LHRTPTALPIPGTTSINHLEQNLTAATVRLSTDEVNAITALASEDN
jgi:aryl-alcohol dehydrogenase-like predicted oxidoreductase